MTEALSKLNSQPVNRMAASMFWKTPEWAIVPSSVKIGVIEARMKPEEINIDYFRPPDKRPVNEVQPLDHRGRKFNYKSPNDGVCMVVGYAGERTKEGTARVGVKPSYWVGDWGSKRKHGRKHNLKKWWCLMPDKTYREFNWKTICKLIVAFEDK